MHASGTGNGEATLVSAGTSGWNLHWSYDCSNAAGGRGVFIVDVFKADHSPDTAAPGLFEQGTKDTAVYHVPGAGRFYLEVTSTCRWTLEGES